MMHRPGIKSAIGPDGSPLTIANLPPTTTKRWVIRRKAEVVSAVRGGILSLEKACSRYTLTVDEFLSWQASIEQHGLAGLRTTRLQHYRMRSDRAAAAGEARPDRQRIARDERVPWIWISAVVFPVDQAVAAVRGQATAVEIGCDFLTRDGWKRERRDRIVGHGGRGWRETRKGLA